MGDLWNALHDASLREEELKRINTRRAEAEKDLAESRDLIMSVLHDLPQGTVLVRSGNYLPASGYMIDRDGLPAIVTVMDSHDATRILDNKRATELAAQADPETNGDAEAVPNTAPTAVVPPSPDLGDPVPILPEGSMGPDIKIGSSSIDLMGLTVARAVEEAEAEVAP